jgi:superfamily I DNA/RNA helicase
MVFTPSPRQIAIAEAMQRPGNILVQACAGSGKTTTMVWLAGLIPTHQRVLALSFNKSISDELANRMPVHVQSNTMHSLGLRMIKRVHRGVRLEERKLQALLDGHPGIALVPEAIRGLIVSDLRAIIPLAQDTLTDPHNIDLLAALAEIVGRPLEAPKLSLPMAASVMDACDQVKEIITFCEMIRHPTIHNYPNDFYDVVFVDEAQDLNGAQHALLKKLVMPGRGKLIAVGDFRQSVYSFRGADPRSMSRLKNEWDMQELPLDISYRCDRAIVAEAQNIVGSELIRPRDDAAEGSVETMDMPRLASEARPGDMIICRTNAPLVSIAIQLSREGKKAQIRGRDISGMLTALVRRSKAGTIPALQAWLASWRQSKVSEAILAKKSESSIQSIEDQADTLLAVVESCSSVSDVLVCIDNLFDEREVGICLSTVHRAKGLEADTVFIAGPELLPAPWAKSDTEKEQERNLAYVAVTRAKHRLVRVPLPKRKPKDAV